MVKKILSIDGGALAGVIPLAVCIAIEEQTGQQLKDIFDLFVGTSTGALIAGAAIRGIVPDPPNDREPFGLTAEEILQIYYERADFIFGDGAINPGRRDIPILNVNKYPKYNPARLLTVIREVFGGGRFTRLSSSPKDIAITAYNVTDRRPEIFRSYTGNYRELEYQDAVKASSTVPLSHNMHEIDDKLFIDGGVFAGNPAMYALNEALTFYGSDEDIILVSLGTGISSTDRGLNGPPRDEIQWWLRNIFQIFLDGQEQATDESLKELADRLPRLNYFRFNVDLENRDSTNPDRELLESYYDAMKQLLETDNPQRDKLQELIPLLG
ncbi:MAG: patatin-like phospholipase family protein [Xenococcus sp. MO_188.B8]|nr:patatin-like phospholipase family protein [Xenococcus sp. MO_188.B8]